MAYNAKYNSGCISRQVGAVITDDNFSVKSVGWNDVARGQRSCNLRDVNDLFNGNNGFSEYEKEGSIIGGKFSDFFKNKFPANLIEEKRLKGRICSYCFKDIQNGMEGEKNQVHTRSLHAEENAMLQIVKNGGIGVKGGYLFTTASPCELCSKKAFQLGIKKIYYIDPYPGISQNHILKSGINQEDNPIVVMFKGAVGRAFHKLYEPFMAYKDELKIMTDYPIDIKRDSVLDIINDLKDIRLNFK